MYQERRQVPNPLWLIAGDCIMLLAWNLAWLSIVLAQHFGVIDALCGWFVGSAMTAAASHVLLHVTLSYVPQT